MAVPSFSEGSSASTFSGALILGLERAKSQAGHRCHPVSAAIVLRCSPSAVRSFTRNWARCCLNRIALKPVQIRTHSIKTTTPDFGPHRSQYSADPLPVARLPEAIDSVAPAP